MNKHLSSTTNEGSRRATRGDEEGAGAKEIEAAERMRSYVGKDKNGQTLSVQLSGAVSRQAIEAVQARPSTEAATREGMSAGGGLTSAAVPLVAAGALAAAAAEEKPLEVELGVDVEGERKARQEKDTEKDKQ